MSCLIPEGGDGAVMRRIALVIVGFVLSVGGLAVLPTVSASASASAVGYWTLPAGNVGRADYSCSKPAIHTNSGSEGLAEVRNDCGVRVWLHGYNYSTGKIDAYCVNPGGGLAYDFSIEYTDLQVTTNKSQCDSGSIFQIGWYDGTGFPAYNSYGCLIGKSYTWTKRWVYSVSNADGCNFRIWLHQYDNGTGKSECVNPGAHVPATLGYTSPVYWQVQATGNQVPCDRGGPPY